MISDFFVPFVMVGLAELGDRTQLAVFCLASKTRNYIQLLAGVMLAFALADGAAILLGDLVTRAVPLPYIKAASAVIFIVFGILMLHGDKDSETSCEITKPFVSGFSLVLLSELGDKTQVTAGLLATRFNPLMVFLGVIGALGILSVLALCAGQFCATRINKRVLSRIAAGIFVLAGIASLY
jgi:putative Ca2+/H+ antiporter (TMEM165/GDT1 family)